MNQKQKAEELFLNTEKTQKEIADAVGIDPRTLYRWIQQGQWRELKSATRRMPSVLVENIYAQLDDINYSIAQRERGNRHPTKDESLTISRLMNCIAKVKKEKSMGQNTEFLMNFINYVQPKNDALAKTLTEYGSGFLNEKAVAGFHPYDIEYENNELAPSLASLREANSLCSPAATKQSHDNTDSLAQEHEYQLELPFPEQHISNDTSLSLGEGWGEASIVHESDIPTEPRVSPQQPVNQTEMQENIETDPPEMSENNFPENRASEKAPPLFLGEVPEGGRGLLALDNTPNREPQPDVPSAPQKKKKKPQYPIDPKLIYPGSGVHHRKRSRRSLTKEEYDALFRPDEHKNKPRNNKW